MRQCKKEYDFENNILKFNMKEKGEFLEIDIKIRPRYSKTVERLTELDFSDSYMTVTLALVMKDYESHKYRKTSVIKNMKGLKVAVLKGSAYKNEMDEPMGNFNFIFSKFILQAVQDNFGAALLRKNSITPFNFGFYSPLVKKVN